MIEKMKAAGSREAARLRMADLCARSEQCEADILAKLLKMGLARGQADEIIGELVKGRFIDNRRYASALAVDAVRFSGWGRRKIAAKLVSKRIDSSLIREALADLDEEEYFEAAMRAARDKVRHLDLRVYEDRMKLMRHLASRGFEGSVASKAAAILKREAEDGMEGA